VLFNIESKVNPVMMNQTRSAAEFVSAMAKVFVGRGGDVLERITHQSFDVSLNYLSSFCFVLSPSSSIKENTLVERRWFTLDGS